MNRLPNTFFGVMTAIWVSILAWAFFPISPPMEYLPGDTVHPLEVKVGGTIFVTRHIKVIREEPVTIIRSLVRGDCAKACDVVDLPSSTIALTEIERRSQAREIVLPNNVTPGKWRIAFRYLWEDRVGRTRSEQIPSLSFTVIP